MLGRAGLREPSVRKNTRVVRLSRAAIGVALLWTGACASEGAPTGPSERAPAATADGVDPVPADDAAFLWDQNHLRTYEILIDPEKLAEIDGDPLAEAYVPADLIFEGEHHRGVAVRYKGSLGTFAGCTAFDPDTGLVRKACAKLSMKVRFNRNDRERRFHGLRKVQFHAMGRDPSMLRERLAYALFRSMGIAAPRAVHVRLMINGAFAGLFVLVEQIDGSFDRSRFADGGKGNLYKEIWPVWTDEAAYERALKTNETDPEHNHDRVLRFGAALQDARDSRAVAALTAQWMDTAYLMRFIAVDRTLKHDDGMFHWYCGLEIGNNPHYCSNHNYYVYVERDADQLWLIPWDLDHTFYGRSRSVHIPDAWNDLSVSCDPDDGISRGPPACDKLTRGWAQFDDEYRSAVQLFIDGPFADAPVMADLDAWAAQITPVIQEEAAAGLGPPVADWQRAVERLRTEISKVRQLARDGLQ